MPPNIQGAPINLHRMHKAGASRLSELGIIQAHIFMDNNFPKIYDLLSFFCILCYVFLVWKKMMIDRVMWNMYENYKDEHALTVSHDKL